tara:strand:+ start:1214 stop:2809 length:1596 start_codon:yes stop_codon:yes gene_type:complete
MSNMKTLQEQYNMIQNGKGHKDVFLKRAKKQFPGMINEAATYDQATHILKKRNVISENYIDLKPINTMEGTKKESWEKKFQNFLSEAGKSSLNPIVNNDYNKVNTKEQEDKVSSDPNYKFEVEYGAAGRYKQVSDGVENIASHNYDYSPKVDNINNVNAQEMMNGVYCEIKNDPNLTLEEAQEKVIKNLAKDALFYVKEGQFGVQGLGYTEDAPGFGVKKNAGKTYGGSGFSEKLQDSDNKWEVVKESVNDILKDKNLINESMVATTGNPNSLAAMSSEVINQMLEKEGLKETASSDWVNVNEENKEPELPMDEDVEEARQKAIEASQEKAGMDVSEDDVDEAKGKDHDGDGDVDSDDYLAARDKAIKANMAKKKMKKENIDTKLAEIGKEGDIVKLEAQLEYLTNHIQEKIDRVGSINEDDNLKELVDKKKMKDMQKEIKLLEKRKAKMEKLYEKMSGKSFQMPEVVDEAHCYSEEDDIKNESFDSLVKKVDKAKGYDKEDAKRVAGFIANRKRAGAGSGPTAKMKKREG